MIINSPQDYFEKKYAENGREFNLDPNTYYNKFAKPLRQGGNNHRYRPNKAHFDSLLNAGDGRFLDCACGPGQHAIWLALNGKKVWAFDYSKNAIKIAIKSSKLSGVKNHLNFQAMDARNLDYEDSFFDVITGRDCLHHLIEHPSAIKEICRVLKPGGVGYFVEPLAWNPLVNILRRINIQVKGHKGGEHMLKRSDVTYLHDTFGSLTLDHHVVLSAFTRLMANTHKPLIGVRRHLVKNLDNLDNRLLSHFPQLAHFSAMSFIKVNKITN